MNPINTTPPSLPTTSPPVKPNAGPAGTDATTSGANAASNNAPSPAANPPVTSSTVTTISSISTQLQAAQATSSSDSVFATSKVNEIKQAISEGRFQVNAHKVADGLLDSVNELLNSRRH